MHRGIQVQHIMSQFPVEISGYQIPVPREPLSVSLMGTNEGLDYTMHEGRLEVIVPRLELLAGVVIKWDED